MSAEHNDALDELILNKWPFLLAENTVKPLVEIEYGANASDASRPDFGHLVIGRGQVRSLFRNAMLYLRLAWPFGIFWSLRWSGATDRRALMQGALGWKLNGRWTMGVLWLVCLPVWYLYGWQWWYLVGLFAIRIQSDASSAAGATGPNYGQATGWLEGDH